MTTLLKFLHIATIAVWSAGLLVLPLLILQRRRITDAADAEQLYRITRFVFVALTSPAAVVAIGTGTALIFLQATFNEWFTLKMVLVGAMAMLHVLAGVLLTGMYTGGRRIGPFGFWALTLSYAVLIVGVLWVVLAKPTIDSGEVGKELFAPGELKQRARQILGDTRTPTP